MTENTAFSNNIFSITFYLIRVCRIQKLRTAVSNVRTIYYLLRHFRCHRLQVLEVHALPLPRNLPPRSRRLLLPIFRDRTNTRTTSNVKRALFQRTLRPVATKVARPSADLLVFSKANLGCTERLHISREDVFCRTPLENDTVAKRIDARNVLARRWCDCERWRKEEEGGGGVRKEDEDKWGSKKPSVRPRDLHSEPTAAK